MGTGSCYPFTGESRFCHSVSNKRSPKVGKCRPPDLGASSLDKYTAKVDPHETFPENGLFGNFAELADNPTFQAPLVGVAHD
jgi:hypothetical protein